MFNQIKVMIQMLFCNKKNKDSLSTTFQRLNIANKNLSK